MSTIIKDGGVASRIGHVPVLEMNETDVSLIIMGMSKWRTWNIGGRLT